MFVDEKRRNRNVARKGSTVHLRKKKGTWPRKAPENRGSVAQENWKDWTSCVRLKGLPALNVAFADYVNGDTKNDIIKGPKELRDRRRSEEDYWWFDADAARFQILEYRARLGKEPLHLRVGSGEGLTRREASEATWRDS